jgi:hypothetical protein
MCFDFVMMYFSYNEELHNLYSSSDITRAIKSNKIGWARHECKILVIKLDRCTIGQTEVRGRTVLKWILKKRGVGWNQPTQDKVKWRPVVIC